MGRRAWVAATIVLLSACSACKLRRSSPRRPPSQAEGKLEVDFAGCDFVLEGGRCLGGGAIRIWVRASGDSKVSLFLDERPIEQTPTPVDGGLRWNLQRPTAADSHRLDVRVDDGGARFELSLEPAPPPVDALDDRDLAEIATSSTATTARDRLRACAALHEIAVRRLRASKPDAEPAFLRALACARSEGSTSGEAVARVGLAITSQQAGRLDQADTWLATESAQPAGEARYIMAYRRGLVERDLGDLRSALRSLSLAERGEHRLDSAAKLINVRQVQVPLLQSLGRTAEALERARALLEATTSAPPGLRGQVLANVAWAALIEREGQYAKDPSIRLGPDTMKDWPDPGQLSATAIDLLLQADKPDRVANSRLNLAIHHTQRADAARALEALSDLDPGQLLPVQQSWLLDVQGRIALLQGRLRQAKALYAELRSRSEGDPDGTWRALVGLGRAYADGAELRESARVLFEAEALLDAMVRNVGVGQGRLGLSRRRDASARLLVDVLVRLGRARDAEQVARRARARAWRSLRRLASLEALDASRRAEWAAATSRYLELTEALRVDREQGWDRSLSDLLRAKRQRVQLRKRAEAALEEALAALPVEPTQGRLREPSTGELLVTYFPADREWVAFARTVEGTEVHRLGTWSTDESIVVDRWAARLLEPLDAAIERAETVRLMPHTWLEGIDVHALPWRGQPLVTQRSAAYALDVSAEARPSGRDIDSVLVLGNASGDLPAAAAEVRRVAKIHAEAGRRVFSMEGEGVRSHRALKVLPEVDLFHYAGHASYSPQGLDSFLVMNGDDRMTISDILALPKVPRAVVLSGCETARFAGGGSVVDLGLAQAFLLKGADVVIASDRAVADDLSLELSSALHRTPGDFVEAMSRAVTGFVDERREWSAFRALVP